MGGRHRHWYDADGPQSYRHSSRRGHPKRSRSPSLWLEDRKLRDAEVRLFADPAGNVRAFGWYEGKPAAIPLRGTDGVVSVAEGETRTGGSYTKRFANVAVWNSVIDQYGYHLLRWKELLLG